MFKELLCRVRFWGPRKYPLAWPGNHCAMAAIRRASRSPLCGERILGYDAGTGIEVTRHQSFSKIKNTRRSIYSLHTVISITFLRLAFASAPFFREDSPGPVSGQGNLTPSNSDEHRYAQARPELAPGSPVPIEIFKAEIEFPRDFKSGDVLQLL